MLFFCSIVINLEKKEEDPSVDQTIRVPVKDLKSECIKVTPRTLLKTMITGVVVTNKICTTE